jgi:putative tryptophan/tyrosine transport system substrate-binding protein
VSKTDKSIDREYVKTITLLTLCVSLLAFCSWAQAQPHRLYRIGYLSALSRSSEATRSESIRLALRELGYAEGRHISTEYRYSDGNPGRAPDLAAELARIPVDLIVVAGGDQWIRAAVKATKTIPIVMVGGGLDPVEAGHVESLAHPGRNVTGLTILNTEVGRKRLELLKESVPRVVRIAVLYRPDLPSNVRELKEVQAAAHALNLMVQPLAVTTPDDLEKAFVGLHKDNPHALYVCQGPPTTLFGKQVAEFALKMRLASLYSNREAVDSGGLLSYGADRVESYRRVAVYIDKILKGAKPADLPVEQPTKFEFVINLKTAKQIGLTIPPNVLARADRVIR